MKRPLLLVALAIACAPEPQDGNSGRGPHSDTGIPDVPLGESILDEAPPSDPDALAPYQQAQADELASFMEMGQQIGQIQTWNQTRNPDQATMRGFHAKKHLCILGTLQVVEDSELPPQAQFGIFSQPNRTYTTWVRFSNGVGSPQHDALPDVRGLALKVLGVSEVGTKLREDDSTSSTQDFLTTNSPSQLASDAAGFLEFALAQANPSRLAMIRWFAQHWRAGLTLLSRTTRPVPTLLGETFYSGGAYRLGPRAIRFGFQPCAEPSIEQALLDELAALRNRITDTIDQLIGRGELDLTMFDYLTADVRARLPQGICFDMFVQFQSTAEETPIEDASAVWMTPRYRVAQLTVSPQDIDEASESSCDQFGWTPWHSLEEHRPLGNINRARKIVYSTSRLHRLGDPEQLPPEPSRP